MDLDPRDYATWDMLYTDRYGEVPKDLKIEEVKVPDSPMFHVRALLAMSDEEYYREEVQNAIAEGSILDDRY